MRERGKVFQKPAVFWLPGLFLLLLGLGNALVGKMKTDQFEEVLQELESAQHFKEEVSASPMIRLQLSRKLADQAFERRSRFEERRNFYRTVAFGGKVVMVASLGFFAIAMFITWRTGGQRNEQAKSSG